ncbi:MAG: acylneuraminate cytidylyltransferase family protein [Bacteroidales bacterium]|nr:acylneuraminate cytidylyltransferase family protein [Bacteroidales bacterium]
MKILITICARGGSKGIPGKNVRMLNGKPLIAYSIKVANEFCQKHNAVLTLSTDSIDIKNIAAQFGLFTEYVRPAEMATDNAGKIGTINDVLLFEEKKRGVRFDFILDLDVTSPLRTIDDLICAFEIIKNDENALNLFSVNNCHRNPYFNMVEKSSDGYYKLVKQPETPILSRQTAPKVYDLNASFYFYRRKFFDLNFKNAYTPYSLVYEMPHSCFDLDEPIDFTLMELMLRENLIDFEL